MFKLLQILLLAVAVAQVVSVTTSNPDDFQFDDGADADLEIFEGLTDDNMNACPTVSSPCQSGEYLDATSCLCIACPNAQTSNYSPVRPWPNVGQGSCFACPSNMRVLQCSYKTLLGIFNLCGKQPPANGICLNPAMSQKNWAALFQSFGWIQPIANFFTMGIPLLFPGLKFCPSTGSYQWNTCVAAPVASSSAPVAKFDESESVDDEQFFDEDDNDVDENDVDDIEEDAQANVASCSSYGCCPPGTYGTNSATPCTVCPAGTTTAYAVPDANCLCPNTVSTSCIACNPCEVRNAMGQCVSKCIAGQRCSLTPTKTKTGTAVAAFVCYV